MAPSFRGFSASIVLTTIRINVMYFFIVRCAFHHMHRQIVKLIQSLLHEFFRGRKYIGKAISILDIAGYILFTIF